MYSSCLYRKYRHENDCVKCRFRVVSQFVKKKKQVVGDSVSGWVSNFWICHLVVFVREKRRDTESERCGVLPAHTEAVLRTAHAMAVPDCEMGE